MDMPPEAEYVYLPNPSAAVPSRVYHVTNCNGRLEEEQREPVTPHLLTLLRRMGYTLCKTCSLRYEKALKQQEQAEMLEQYRIASLEVPEEFELRVYWHRGVGQPVEIWSSRGGAR